MTLKIDKALEEVWELKKSCYEEVKDLPLSSALQKRLEDSIESAKKLNFRVKTIKMART